MKTPRQILRENLSPDLVERVITNHEKDLAEGRGDEIVFRMDEPHKRYQRLFPIMLGAFDYKSSNEGEEFWSKVIVDDLDLNPLVETMMFIADDE